jgi:ABC-2 type transport system ATP-binding protein
LASALRFLHVSKSYRRGAPPALDDVSFAISEGSRTCLLGPNGAGKSTSIRLLEGAIRPTRGEVELLGAAIDGPGYLAARRRTGIVPQSPGLYGDLTTAEYLQLARDVYGRGKVEDVVEIFRLSDELPKRMAQLSGGFQRRVVLAAALLGEPDLLLLDEPTVGLDPLAAHDVHAYLRQAMARERRTTLLCTHNLAEAEALCDEVIILRDGKVLIHEPLSSLKARAHAGLRLEAAQGPAALLDALGRRGYLTSPDGNGTVTVILDQPRAHAPGLLRALLDDGLDVYRCEPLSASLEQLFLDLVRT